jgi:hypothetical protein
LCLFCASRYSRKIRKALNLPDDFHETDHVCKKNPDHIACRFVSFDKMPEEILLNLEELERIAEYACIAKTVPGRGTEFPSIEEVLAGLEGSEGLGNIWKENETRAEKTKEDQKKEEKEMSKKAKDDSDVVSGLEDQRSFCLRLNFIVVS